MSQNSATALPLFRARLQLGVTAGESPEPEPAARRGPCLLVKSDLLPVPESRPSFYHVLEMTSLSKICKMLYRYTKVLCFMQNIIENNTMT